MMNHIEDLLFLEKKTKNCYDEEFRQLRVFSKIFFVKIG